MSARPIGMICDCPGVLPCNCLEKAQRDWDKKFWLNHRKTHEALLIQLASRTTKKTKKFVAELDRISNELKRATTELEKLK